MAINATNEGGTPRELVPAGTHIARCCSMIHIGTNIQSYMGEDKQVNSVRITFELPGEMRTFEEGGEEKPMVISKEYTLSMYEKANLRKDLESWRGVAFTEEEAANFDITKLLGVPCQISIIHAQTKKGNDFAKISNISGLMKGVECPAQINPIFEFNYEDKFSDEVVESFPDFIKEKIKSSDEYKALKEPVIKSSEDDFFDETPEEGIF